MLITSLLFVSSTLHVAKNSISNEKETVLMAINQPHKCMITSYFYSYNKMICTDENMVFIGTDENEFRIGKEQLVPDIKKWIQTSGLQKIEPDQQIIHISNDGQVAWYADIARIKGQNEEGNFEVTGIRRTGVLRKQNNKRNIVQ